VRAGSTYVRSIPLTPRSARGAARGRHERVVDAAPGRRAAELPAHDGSGDAPLSGICGSDLSAIGGMPSLSLFGRPVCYRREGISAGRGPNEFVFLGVLKALLIERLAKLVSSRRLEKNCRQ